MSEVICNRCNYKWWSRVDEPKACPKCKSIYWNTKRSRPILKKSK